MIENELFERALKQKFISVDDAKRFTEAQLNSLIVSDSINGAKPKSLFNVNESISERVRLQDNTISNEDFNKITPVQKQELISKGIYPTPDAPTVLTNLPFVTRAQFEGMTPQDRQKVVSDKIEIKNPEEVKELNFNHVSTVLLGGYTDGE